MLFDGAIRFAEQGRAALDQKNFEASHKALTQSQKIITELITSLRHDVFPELCGKLAALYTYAHRNLVQANIKHQTQPIDEALKVLRYQRQTWVMLLDQLSQTKAAQAAEAASRLDIPAPDERMEASISMQA